MSRWIVSLIFASALAGLVLACPYVVPAFKLGDNQGRQWTGSSLTKKPTILVFLKEGCPSNPRAVPLLNDLQRQLGEKAQVLGVVNAQPAATSAYAKKLGLTFPVLADEQGVLIKGFGAKRSLQFSVVATKAEPRWAKIWEGLGQAELADAIKLIQGHGHPLPSLDLKGVPENAISGCTF